jgi:hypothetical protein
MTVEATARRLPSASRTVDLVRRPRRREALIQVLLVASALLSIFTTVAIVFILVREALLFFRAPQVNLIEFLTGTVWQPAAGHFGVWPLLSATLRTSLLAVLVAVPLGLAAAIYLSEYASARARSVLKPVLEILAGIPTVVYGYFALTFMTPLLRSIFGVDVVQFYNTASAGLVMGIMIVPLISSMSEDALSAVPRPAGGILRPGGDAPGNGSARRRPGGPLRHLRRHADRHGTRHRRDDDCRHCGRRWPRLPGTPSFRPRPSPATSPASAAATSPTTAWTTTACSPWPCCCSA